jgi:hypothetical protein
VSSLQDEMPAQDEVRAWLPAVGSLAQCAACASQHLEARAALAATRASTGRGLTAVLASSFSARESSGGAVATYKPFGPRPRAAAGGQGRSPTGDQRRGSPLRAGANHVFRAGDVGVRVPPPSAEVSSQVNLARWLIAGGFPVAAPLADALVLHDAKVSLWEHVDADEGRPIGFRQLGEVIARLHRVAAARLEDVVELVLWRSRLARTRGKPLARRSREPDRP